MSDSERYPSGSSEDDDGGGSNHVKEQRKRGGVSLGGGQSKKVARQSDTPVESDVRNRFSSVTPCEKNMPICSGRGGVKKFIAIGL